MPLHLGTIETRATIGKHSLGTYVNLYYPKIENASSALTGLAEIQVENHTAYYWMNDENQLSVNSMKNDVATNANCFWSFILCGYVVDA